MHENSAALAMHDDVVVYWMVPPNGHERHGITDRPGRWPDGTSVTALCGELVKIPFVTHGSTPRSKSITEQCADCVEKFNETSCRSTIWDY